MHSVEDNFYLKGKRQQLIKQLSIDGITDKSVLKVMADIPRHYFLNPMYIDHAYDNKPLPIDKNQTISQPYTVAYQTQLARIKQDDKVLEIGTGSGYQAAILFYLGAKVYSIERHKTLHDKTKKLLSKLNIKIHLFYGDGFKGQPLFAPFNKIIITAAAPDVPQELLRQLVVGGILVVPIGKGNTQTMTTFTKVDDTNFDVNHHGRFSFVPMLKGKE